VPTPSTDYEEGKTVVFAGYEWLVLEISEGQALLLSSLITERRIYHGPDVLTSDGPRYTELGTTWAECKLRAYLNGEFYEGFSESDRALIVETHNVNPDNPWYYEERSNSFYDDRIPRGGEDTIDKIFILSVDEVVKYFGDSGQLANKPERYLDSEIDDEYNEARIAYRREGWENNWWLRTPGIRSSQAVEVNANGTISMMGGTVYNIYAGVRPALWLNLAAMPGGAPPVAATPMPTSGPADYVEGNIVSFAGYAWLVLEVREGQALLLSEYVSESRAYKEAADDSEDVTATWADSDLRAYLNGEFLDSFSEGDRERIVETHNLNQNNQWSAEGIGGDETDDFIFLLSLEEVVKYFGDSGQLANEPPNAGGDLSDEYNGARIATAEGGSQREWWLRSPGCFNHLVVIVKSNGRISMNGNYADIARSVRPALWVNIE
jgi:hypothetical protein